jgi:hypothetical protein
VLRAGRDHLLGWIDAEDDAQIPFTSRILRSICMTMTCKVQRRVLPEREGKARSGSG